MADFDKRWIGLGSAVLLIAVVGGAYLFGGSDEGAGDTTSASGSPPASESSAVATTGTADPASATGAGSTSEATGTTGTTDTADADDSDSTFSAALLAALDPMRAPPSIGGDTAFHPLEACRPGVGPFTSDLQFTFSPITDSLWAIDTVQRGTQASYGALDVPSGVFIAVGGGANYGEVYIGQLILTGPPTTPDGLLILGINVSGSAGSWVDAFSPYTVDQREQAAGAAFAEQPGEIAFLTEAGRTWFYSFGDEPSVADLPPNADIAAQLAAALDGIPLPPPLDTVAAESSGCGLSFGVQAESWW